MAVVCCGHLCIVVGFASLSYVMVMVSSASWSLSSWCCVGLLCWRWLVSCHAWVSNIDGHEMGDVRTYVVCIWLFVIIRLCWSLSITIVFALWLWSIVLVIRRSWLHVTVVGRDRGRLVVVQHKWLPLLSYNWGNCHKSCVYKSMLFMRYCWGYFIRYLGSFH